MAKKNDGSEVEVVDVAAMKKQLDDVCAKVRRISDNWKKFAAKFIGTTDDGKLSGRAAVGLAVCLLVLSCAGLVLARDVWNVGSTAIGTAKVTTSDAGTATLEVDAVSATITGALTGDWTGDDLTASGAVTATLDLNLPGGTTNTYATVNVKLAQIASQMEDDGAVLINLLNAYNASTEAVDYAQMQVITTDVTTNTEDAAVDFLVMSGGALASGMKIGSTSAGVKTATLGTGFSLEGAVGSVTPAAGAFTTVAASSSATVASKGVVVDSSANVQMIQTTNVTMHAGTVWTNTFPIVFGATPTTVIITPTELHAAVPFYTAATPSNILVTVEADKDFTLTCIGKK